MDYPNQHMVDAIEALGDKWRVYIDRSIGSKTWYVDVRTDGRVRSSVNNKDLGKAIAAAYEVLIQKEIKGLSILKAA